MPHEQFGPDEANPGGPPPAAGNPDDLSAQHANLRSSMPSLDVKKALYDLQLRMWAVEGEFEGVAAASAGSFYETIQSSIAGVISPYAAPGGDFHSAIAELRGSLAARLAALPAEHENPAAAPLVERTERLDIRALDSALARLEQLYDVLGITDKDELKSRALEALGPKTLSALRREVEGPLLTRIILIEAAAALSERTLDVTPVLDLLHRHPFFYGLGLSLAQSFAEATKPDPATGFAALPYERTEVAAGAREAVRAAIWSSALNFLQQGNNHLFHAGFSALTWFGMESLPHFREFFRRINAPQAGEVQPEVRAIRVALMTLSNPHGHLGPRAFDRFVSRDPAPQLDLREPTNIIEDALVMTTHPDSTLQELAFKFLRVVAPDDSHVRRKFIRLGNQLEELPQGVIGCVISMNPLQEIIKWSRSNNPVVQAEAVKALVNYEKLAGDARDPAVTAALDEIQRLARVSRLNPLVIDALVSRSSRPGQPPRSA